MIELVAVTIIAATAIGCGWLYAYLIDEAVKYQAWDKYHEDEFFI